MSDSWESEITDAAERKVFQSLSDPAWDFRTIRGIVKSSGLPEAQVRAIIAKRHDLIRRSDIPDRDGGELFTLRMRPIKAAERLALTRGLFAKSL